MVAASVPGLSGMARPVPWCLRQFELLGVDLRAAYDATPADLLDADTVVVATGSRGARWDEGGLAHEPAMPWLTVRDAFGADLDGRRVLVHAVDQSLEPLGLAELLARRGAAVTVTTPTHAVGAQVEAVTRPLLLDRLARQGVRIRVLNALTVDAAGAPMLASADDGSATRPVADDFDTLVLGLGAVAEDRLHHELAAVHPDVRLVGDAFAPRRLVAATQHAWSVGTAL